MCISGVGSFPVLTAGPHDIYGTFKCRKLALNRENFKFTFV